MKSLCTSGARRSSSEWVHASTQPMMHQRCGQKIKDGHADSSLGGESAWLQVALLAGYAFGAISGH